MRVVFFLGFLNYVAPDSVNITVKVNVGIKSEKSATDKKDEYANDWHGLLHFECPEGEHISQMESIFGHDQQDRRWRYQCTNEGYVGKDCYWMKFDPLQPPIRRGKSVMTRNRSFRNADFDGDYLNPTLDYRWNQYCTEKGYGVIVGFKSKYVTEEHDNPLDPDSPGWTDAGRKWKVKCCDVIDGTDPYTDDCKWSVQDSDELNDAVDKVVGHGWAIHGIQGNKTYDYYDPIAGTDFPPIQLTAQNDTIWNIYKCKHKVCTLDSMAIKDENVLPEPTSEKFIGVSTATMCDEGSTAELKLESVRGFAETSTFTIAKGEHFSTGTSLTLEESGTFGFFEFFSASIGLALTISSEKGKEYTYANEHGTENYEETMQGLSIKFGAFKGGLVAGVVSEYKFNTDKLAVKFKYSCVDSTGGTTTRYEDDGTVTLKATVFGHANFLERINNFTDKAQCEAQQQCLGKLTNEVGKLLWGQQLMDKFDECFL